MIIDELIDAIAAKGGNPSVIGLDTCVDYLPDDMRAKCNTLEDSAKYIRDFNFALIDTLAAWRAWRHSATHSHMQRKTAFTP